MEREKWQEKGNIIVNINTIMRQKLMPGFALIVRLGLGCMFIYSSLPKIRQPYDFLANVYNFELVGPKLGMLTAMTLPWVELLVGICLVGGIFVSCALLVSIGLGAVFTFALYRGLNISCGCFGSSFADTIGYSTLIRAFVILLMSIAAYLYVIISRPFTNSRDLIK